MHKRHEPSPSSRPGRRSPVAGAPIEPLEPRTLLATTRIMPLGDSITEGFDGDATYRYWLWHQLRQAGHDVDFVGSRRGVFNGTPRFGNFDQDHEGHVGMRADQMMSRVEQWAHDSRADVALLHIGTNDLHQNQSVSSTIDEVETIIDRLRAANARIKVLLAQIIPARSFDVQEFNRRLGDLAARKNTSTAPVIAVNHSAGFDPVNDLRDGLHPDESGEKKLADRWMAALTSVMAPADRNPFLSSLPMRVVRNGLGPVERNRSNGGAAAGDGRTIKLNNTLYKRGLGVYANSDIRIRLDGRYGKFSTDAGVDDEVGNQAGSVIFRIFVDQVKVYDSGPVYGRTGTKRIILNVTGARELRLLVTDKGDGNAGDSAAWANARLFGLLPSGDSSPSGGGGSSGGGSGGGSPGGGGRGGGVGDGKTDAFHPFSRGDPIRRGLWEDLVEPDMA